VATLAGCIVGGVRGFVPLGAFTLGAFAALVAGRQLVLAARTAHRRGLGVWRGLIGRANGGMVVHLGVVVLAVGLTAASSFAHRSVLTLTEGKPVAFDGQRFTLVGVQSFRAPAKSGETVLVDIAGVGVFRPSFSTFNGDTQPVGTPAIHSTLLEDVYLSPYSLTPLANGGVTAQITVVIQPLVMWLWLGGGLIGLGSLLAALPGRRRRPTDPVSVPVPELAGELVHA
jgi:cytochrome c-type biogenesis protein CcmF